MWKPRKALIIWKNWVFGEHNAHVARSYNELASAYYSLGEYNQAKEFFEKHSVMIRKKIYGEDHVEVATSYDNLASVYKWVLFASEWKIISTSKAEHLTSFWCRGPGELGNGLFCVFTHVASIYANDNDNDFV